MLGVMRICWVSSGLTEFVQVYLSENIYNITPYTHTTPQKKITSHQGIYRDTDPSVIDNEMIPNINNIALVSDEGWGARNVQVQMMLLSKSNGKRKIKKPCKF